MIQMMHIYVFVNSPPFVFVFVFLLFSGFEVISDGTNGISLNGKI